MDGIGGGGDDDDKVIKDKWRAAIPVTPKQRKNKNKNKTKRRRRKKLKKTMNKKKKTMGRLAQKLAGAGRLRKKTKTARSKTTKSKGAAGIGAFYQVVQAAFLRLKTAQRRVRMVNQSAAAAARGSGSKGDALSPTSTLPELIAFMEAHPRSSFVFENVNRCAVSEFRCSTQLNELYTQRMVLGSQVVTFVPGSGVGDSNGSTVGIGSELSVESEGFTRPGGRRPPVHVRTNHTGNAVKGNDNGTQAGDGDGVGGGGDDSGFRVHYRLDSDALEGFASACGLQVERLIAFSNSSDNARYFPVFKQLRLQIKRTAAHLQSLVKLATVVSPVLKTARALFQEFSGQDDLPEIKSTMRKTVRAVNGLMAAFCVVGSSFASSFSVPKDDDVAAGASSGGGGGGGLITTEQTTQPRPRLNLEDIAKQIAASDWGAHEVTDEDLRRPTFYSIYGITRGVEELNPHANTIYRSLNSRLKAAFSLTDALQRIVSNALIKPMRLLCPRLWYVMYCVVSVGVVQVILQGLLLLHVDCMLTSNSVINELCVAHSLGASARAGWQVRGGLAGVEDGGLCAVCERPVRLCWSARWDCGWRRCCWCWCWCCCFTG